MSGNGKTTCTFGGNINASLETKFLKLSSFKNKKIN